MCLIAFAIDVHPEYPLVFAGNRDEFYARPTAPARFWAEAPEVLAGRDRKAGGTWLGVTRTGRWASITNVRDPSARIDDAPSRGHLVADYLTGDADPDTYLREVAARGDRYNGFNLLVGDGAWCGYVSNRTPNASTHNGDVRRVEAGIHGLSNAALNTPWPKVTRATGALRGVLDDAFPGESLDPERLLTLLDDRRRAPDDALPDTGVGRDAERMLSPVFIESDGYGTRASTVLLIDRNGHVTFAERTYDAGRAEGTRTVSFATAEPTTR